MDVTFNDKTIMFDGQCQSPSIDWTPQPAAAGAGNEYEYMRHCEACILVYDSIDQASLEAIKLYHRNILLERSSTRSSCIAGCSPSCTPRPNYRGLLLIIANKIDLNNGAAFTRAEGEAFAASIGAKHISISAKTGDGANKDLLSQISKYVMLYRTKYLASLNRDKALDEGRSELVKPYLQDYRTFWY